LGEKKGGRPETLSCPSQRYAVQGERRKSTFAYCNERIVTGERPFGEKKEMRVRNRGRGAKTVILETKVTRSWEEKLTWLCKREKSLLIPRKRGKIRGRHFQQTRGKCTLEKTAKKKIQGRTTWTLLTALTGKKKPAKGTVYLRR